MSMKSKLGMTGAVLTLVAAFLTPFLLMNTFAKGFRNLGLRVDETYTGGKIVRQTTVNGHALSIHEAVRPKMLQRGHSFVEVDWANAAALPRQVDDLVDIDGDGQPDARVRFEVPVNAKAPVYVDAEPLNSKLLPMHHAGKSDLTALIVRVDDKIVVRLPLAAR